VGSVIRSRRLVSTYSSTLKWLLFVNVAVDTFHIIMMFRLSKATFISDCIDGSTDQNVINTCNHVNEVRFISVGWIIVSIFIQAYLCLIVARYVEQLYEEDDEKYRLRSLKAQSGGYYQANRSSMEALTHPNTQSYPYADGKHSFGGNNV